MSLLSGNIGKIISKSKEMAQKPFAVEQAKEALPKTEPVQNNYVSRRRARQLQSSSKLNTQTTLLGG